MAYGETVVAVRHVGRGVGPGGDYAIGEAHAAGFHVVGPTAPLVSADGATLLFSAEDDGDVVIAGEPVAFAALIANGWVRMEGGRYRWPIAAGGRCSLRRGGATFVVRAVDAETVRVGRGRIERPALAYHAGALVVLGGLLVLMGLVPRSAGFVRLDPDDEGEGKFVGYIHRASVQPRVEGRAADVVVEAATTDATEPARAAGRTELRRSVRPLRSRGYAGGMPRLTRGYDPELEARRLGVFLIPPQNGTYGGAYADDADDADVWGGLTGAEIGERSDVGGVGLAGTGIGGVGAGEGVIGLGNVGLLGKGGGCGAKCVGGGGRDGGVGFGGRGSRVPVVRQARAEVAGGLDTAVVRRVVRSHLFELRLCYDEALARDPQAKGRVTVELFVGPAGQVSGAVAGESTVRDEGLVACTLAAARRWRFPRGDGGTVVTYPFTFEPA